VVAPQASAAGRAQVRPLYGSAVRPPKTQLSRFPVKADDLGCPSATTGRHRELRSRLGDALPMKLPPALEDSSSNAGGAGHCQELRLCGKGPAPVQFESPRRLGQGPAVKVAKDRPCFGMDLRPDGHGIR
jgi:hypothetical protein